MQHDADMVKSELAHVNDQNTELKKQLEMVSTSFETAKDGITEMKAQIISLKRDLEEQKRIAEQKLSEQKRSSEQAQELAVERAVIQAEKSMQEQISTLRDEKTRLQVQIEILQKKSNDEE